MRRSSIPSWFHALFLAAIVCAAMTALPAAHAQKAPPATSTPPKPAAAKSVAPAAVPPDEIGIVDGIPITQVEWDRLAKPYYEEVEARAGRPLNDEERKLLQKNVLDELIRERLWLADAQRRGMKPSDVEVDSRMKQSQFFKTNGQVDESKFEAFKSSPTSNYPELKSQAVRTLELEEYERWMERRFGPREAELKKTFEERTSQASIRYAVVGPDAVSLEPEATVAQVRAYYDAHPDEFVGAEEAHIQCIRIAANGENAASDSSKEAASHAALKTANEMLAQLKTGASAETAAKPHGGIHDPGWFRVGDPVRGLGRSDALTAAIRAGEPGEWIREPIRIGPYYVLVRLVERRAAERQPFREVAPMAKRKADAALREDAIDSLARAEVREHPQKYYVPRVTARTVARSFNSFDPGRTPSQKEIEKRLTRLRQEMHIADSSRAWIDSARVGIPEMIRNEQKRDQAARTFRDIVSRLKKREDLAKVALRYDAVPGTIARYRGEPPTAPLLVEGSLLDTLYTLRPMDVVGPRERADSVFAVRVETVDPSFLPPYDAVRPAAHAAVLEQRKEQTAREAEGYFHEHRGSYRTPTRWVIAYVMFEHTKPGDMTVPQDSIAAYWREHPIEFTEPAKAHVRHVLITFRAADGSAAREAARKKALAARKRVVDGEDFATVAREVSDDPGSAPKGGDLGEIPRGATVKEFSDVAFTIPVGDVSEVFETRFGFHFLQVESRKPDHLRPLTDCEEEIHEVLGRDLADSLARKSCVEFISAASKPGASFDSLAARKGGAIRSKPVANGEPLGTLGPAIWLEKAVAPLSDGGVAPAPIALADGYLAVQRIRELPPEPASFDQVRERVIADYQLQRRRAVADSVDTIVRSAFEGGADPESLFVPFGGLRISRQFGREGPIPDLSRDPSMARDSTYLSRIFSTSPGGRLPPLKGNTGTLYAVVDTVAVLPPEDFAKHRDALLHELIDQRVEAWTLRLRSKAPIRIHRKDLRSQLG